MDISIIIVNYNTPTLTLACVESIYKHASGVSLEVIIVDNDSTDSGRQSILQQYPNVLWIQNSYNAGFGRANNLGVKSARASVLLFLNSDTLFAEDSIAVCYRRMNQDREIVAAGVQLLNTDGSKQDSAYDAFYWTTLADGIPYVGLFLRYPSVLIKKILRPISSKEIGYLNGAFLMVKRHALEQIGGFDEDFFMYAEEALLCERLRSQGKLAHYQDIFAFHLIHGSKTNNVFHYGQHQLSIQVFIRKKFGVALYLIFLFFHSISLLLNFIILSGKSVVYTDVRFFKKFKIYFQTFLVWLRFAPKIILRTAFLFKFSLPPNLTPDRNG